MATVRKTKKYFREQLTKNLYSANAVIAEVIQRYFKDSYVCDGKRYTTYKVYAKSDGEFWNCRIEGFEYSKVSKQMYVKIYWQGDITDGYDFVSLNRLLHNDITLPATAEHSSLYIKTEWLHSAFEFVAKFLEK